MIRFFSILLVGACLFFGGSWGQANQVSLKYQPAPIDNPLKGLVPYAGEREKKEGKEVFSHSMEFQYLPLSDLVVGENKYDWEPLEQLLNEVSKRGNHTIFRVYLEYPGKKNVIPEYLLNKGLQVTEHSEKDPRIFPEKVVATPDYSNPALRQCLKNFISMLGKKYDGDPRIGFITAGLLGTWGEWHTYPREELWASKEVQEEVMNAYESSFQKTPILLRYPIGKNDEKKVDNTNRRFGYHDDSFAWATLPTGKEEDSWYFLELMQKAGKGAIHKWKTYPIGGEIRPEAWGKVFDLKIEEPRIQDFKECVERTHVTWLMDSGLFQEETWTKARHERAKSLVRKMGYEFHVSRVKWSRGGKDGREGKEGNQLKVEIQIENRGVAPFYYQWPIEFALLWDEENEKGEKKVKNFQDHRVQGDLRKILPGDPVQWEESFSMENIAPGKYYLMMRVVNPLPSSQKKLLRFANQTQDQHIPGWLSLMEIEWGENVE